MKLSEFKEHLKGITEIVFLLPNGEMVPKHFNVTEIGSIKKNFIDCGGTIRQESYVSFQLWEANDFDHKLAPQKLQDIIKLSEEKLGIKDSEIEVEYQSDTIGKYGLSYNGHQFVLTNKFTDCLASDSCGIPKEKMKVSLRDLSNSNSCCTPGGGCC